MCKKVSLYGQSDIRKYKLEAFKVSNKKESLSEKAQCDFRTLILDHLVSKWRRLRGELAWCAKLQVQVRRGCTTSLYSIDYCSSILARLHIISSSIWLRPHMFGEDEGQDEDQDYN